jgi:DNA mismatch repair ATPase MutS
MRLCSPFTNATIIQNYYDITDKILVNNIDNNIRDNLKGILDIERLLRKIVVKYIQPYELHQIYESFTNIVSLVNTLIKSCLKDDLLVKIDKKSIKLFNNCINYIEENYDLEKLKRNNLIEIKENIYKVGIHKDIDNLIYKIDHSIGFMEKLAKKLKRNGLLIIIIRHDDKNQKSENSSYKNHLYSWSLLSFNNLVNKINLSIIEEGAIKMTLPPKLKFLKKFLGTNIILILSKILLFTGILFPK